MEQGISECDIKLPFSSCEKFNGMIDGTVTVGELKENFEGLVSVVGKDGNALSYSVL